MIEERLKAYTQGVMDGSTVASKCVKLAIQRYLKDLETGHERGLRFDKKAAERPIKFIESLLHHTTGKWAGERFILLPWQVFVLWNLFGWKLADGRRRFRLGYTEVSRKNGKSSLAAAISNYMLLADGEQRPECYFLATKILP